MNRISIEELLAALQQRNKVQLTPDEKGIIYEDIEKTFVIQHKGELWKIEMVPNTIHGMVELFHMYLRLRQALGVRNANTTIDDMLDLGSSPCAF